MNTVNVHLIIFGKPHIAQNIFYEAKYLTEITGTLVNL